MGRQNGPAFAEASAVAEAMANETAGGWRGKPFTRAPFDAAPFDAAQGKQGKQGGAAHICNSAKRSQFSGVGAVVDWLGGQVVKRPSGTIWHMASFCRNGFVLGSNPFPPQEL